MKSSPVEIVLNTARIDGNLPTIEFIPNGYQLGIHISGMLRIFQQTSATVVDKINR